MSGYLLLVWAGFTALLCKGALMFKRQFWPNA